MKGIKKSTALLFLVMSFGIMNSHAGGPWTLPKKSGFVQAQAILPAYQYSKLLNGVGISDYIGVNRRTFNSDFGIYAEFGITDKLDIMTNLPFKYISTGELTDSLYNPELLESGSLFGLSNYALAFKYGLIDKNFKLAVSAHARFNTVARDLDRGLITGFDANAFGLVAHLGGSFGKKSYGFLEAGFMKYTNNFSDAVEIRAEYGTKLGEHFNLSFTLDARHALKNGAYYNANLAQTGFYPNDQSWAAISGKINYELDNGVGFNFATPLVPIRFSRVGFNGTLGIGIYKKW